ncbi:methylmalonyl-CoA epimerase [Thermococcus sp. M39]|uniref:OadG family protein n=1 Tax=unclassified Thermococcus TaxID=2627626 RepID=UPI001438E3FD|nr:MULTISPECIES: OadG family protein [unclassified Thermococcus]NJE07182.1 methylmalonyl-CoA epimerase [Thermococcus sp. M39]NJE12686.1 methylmalonyl-CoA epimerase [Thermococcus sp. LS2]
MVTMQAFLEGLYITILGVTVVFAVLTILAIAMYAIGYFEKRLIEKESPKEAPVVRVEKKVKVEEKPKIEPRKLAVITAAILAYIAEKNAQLRPVPFRRKPSDAWRLYGIQTQMEEVENFNYELGKW